MSPSGAVVEPLYGIMTVLPLWKLISEIQRERERWPQVMVNSNQTVGRAVCKCLLILPTVNQTNTGGKPAEQLQKRRPTTRWQPTTPSDVSTIPLPGVLDTSHHVSCMYLNTPSFLLVAPISTMCLKNLVTLN